MSRPDLLPFIEEQISHWDCCAAIHAAEYLEEALTAAMVSRRPLDLESLAAPCRELAEMARAALVAVTGHDEGDFESVSDCLHMKGMLPMCAQAVDYGRALLEVLASCLFTLDSIEDELKDLVARGVRELLFGVEHLEQVVESRSWLDRVLLPAVDAEKAARSATEARHRQTMEKARAERVEKHDWEAVGRLEAELLASGKSARDLAGIIEKRLGVPKTTYREWRRSRKATE